MLAKQLKPIRELPPIFLLELLLRADQVRLMQLLRLAHRPQQVFGGLGVGALERPLGDQPLDPGDMVHALRDMTPGHLEVGLQVRATRHSASSLCFSRSITGEKPPRQRPSEAMRGRSLSAHPNPHPERTH